MTTIKRLDLSSNEMRDLHSIVTHYEELGHTIPSSLKDKLNNPKEIKRSVKKLVAMSNATDARIKKVTKRIKMAIDYIDKENSKMTYTAIAKYAEVSPITVKKYVTDIIDNKAVTSKNFYYYTLK